MQTKLHNILGSLILLTMSMQLFGQAELKLFLSDSLIIRGLDSQKVKDPFTGGAESPRFFNMNLDNDGKLDLVVFDKYSQRILTFIKDSGENTKYRYSPEFEVFFPKGRHNYYVVDVDRDGWPDVLCGSQDMNRMLFYRNKGAELPKIEFESRGNLLFRHYQALGPFQKNTVGNPVQHIHAFDDIDGDGDIDFVSLSPTGGNLEFYQNRQVESGLPKDSMDLHLSELCLGYFTEGRENVINMNTCKLPKYYVRRHSGGTSIFFIDLNRDGDKEILMGNNGFDNLLMLENGYTDYQANYDTIIRWDSIFPRNTVQAKIKTFPMASYADIDADGIKDLIVTPASNPDYGIKNAEQYMLYLNKNKVDSPLFQYHSNNFLMQQSIDFGGIVSPVFYDYDNDGDQDLFVAYAGDFSQTGDSADAMLLYKNNGTRKEADFKLTSTNFGNLGNFRMRNSRLAIHDMDGNGVCEFYFGLSDGTIKTFKFSNNDINNPLFLTANIVTNLPSHKKFISPTFWDYDNDGKTDLIVGSNDGLMMLFKNTGTNSLPNFTLVKDTFGNMNSCEFRTTTNPPSLTDIGRSTPLAVDLNGDGKKEIISGSIHGEIFAWKPTNLLTDTFERFNDFINFYNSITKDTIRNFNFGRNTSIAAADLDGDSIADVLVGTGSGGFYYLSGKARVFAVDVPKIWAKKINAKVYPNPNTGVFIIDNLPTDKQNNIEVLDITGKTIFKFINQSGIENVDLANYANGIYLVKIVTQGYQDLVVKVIKQ